MKASVIITAILVGGMVAGGLVSCYVQRNTPSLSSRRTFVSGRKHEKMRERTSTVAPRESTDLALCTEPSMRHVSWNMGDLRKSLELFLPVYSARPLGIGKGGMRFEHSFYYWFLVRTLNPTTVIESGAFEGHTVWLALQANPSSQIVSIDPREPKTKFEGVLYLTGTSFIDFSMVQWHKFNVSPEDSLVLFDDHQSGLRRTLEAVQMGFKHLVFDDNFDGWGDSYSLRQICDQNLDIMFAMDDFGERKVPLSKATHKFHFDVLWSIMKIYYEFPPVVANNLTGRKRFAEDRALPSLIHSELDALWKNVSKTVPEFYFQYTFFAYVQL